MGRGKGIESNDEPAEEVRGWEGLGTKHGFWGASAYMLTPSEQQLAFQGPGTGQAAGSQWFCYGKEAFTQLFSLGRGRSFKS